MIDGGAKRAEDGRRTGRQVSASIPTIGYRDRTDHPWPRILQFIAIVTLIYGAARVGLMVGEGRFLWQVGTTSGGTILGLSYLLWGFVWVLAVVIGLLLIVGAISLLRSGTTQLILAGHWAMIVLWLLTFIAGFMIRPGSESVALLFNSLLHAFSTNFFPIMVILILRAHRMR